MMIFDTFELQSDFDVALALKPEPGSFFYPRQQGTTYKLKSDKDHAVY